MSNIHAFTLGAMVACAPCLIFLAFVLCRAPPKHQDQELDQRLSRVGRGVPPNGGRPLQHMSGRVIRSQRSNRLL
jgi:hypothetical protein